MSIQFVCPSCSQPIEVDDEFASRQVVCPYCESVVAAPSHSNLEAARRPSARPADMPAPPPGAPPLHDDQPSVWQPSVLARNRLGNWALFVAIIAWLLMGGVVVCWTVAVFKLMPDDYANLSQNEIRKEFESAMSRFIESPAHASARSVFSVLELLALILALVSAILALAGLTRRSARKGTAIAALVVAVPLLLCTCFATANYALQRAPAG